MLLVRLVITLLCAVGFYASVFMLRKSVLDARGRLHEASVVQSPRAKLFGGIPNALIGAIYYPALLAAAWLGRSGAVYGAAFVAALCAAGVSAFLAYSLLFVTKRSCLYCFLAHAANFGLAAATARLLVLH